MARTGGGACPGRADGKGAYGAALCAIAIHELDEEAIELIFTFLPVEDRRSAAAVCRLWRRVHNSSTKLWGSVLLSGERIVQASCCSAAGEAGEGGAGPAQGAAAPGTPRGGTA